MTKARAKAQELVDKFLSIQDSQAKEGGGLMFKEEAKQCAKIVVDEILNSRKKHLVQSIIFYEFWEEVKQEIEKL